MKKKKNNKVVAVVYFVAAVCLYICAILNFINDGDSGVVYICLGSVLLCLGVLWLNKGKKENKEE